MKPARALKGLLGSALWLGLGAAIVDAADAVPPEAGSGRERSAADRPVTPEQLAFFESKIRPVLENCYKCHSASSEKIKGELRARHAGRHPQGGRPGRRGRAGQPRGEPADPGDPLQGRRPPDAAEDRSCPTRSSPTSSAGWRWVPPTRATARRRPSAKGIDIEEGRRVLGVPAPAESDPARRSKDESLAAFGHRPVPARCGSRPRD